MYSMLIINAFIQLHLTECNMMGGGFELRSS